MYGKDNNEGKISGSTACGSGHHGCNLKNAPGDGCKTRSKGGCCAGSGFHQHCHCSKEKVDCKAMCNKDTGCLGWVKK